MTTFHVSLTKASNTSVKHTFLLQEDKEGAPRVRLGSREKEAAKAGQRGTIVIQSLHHGAGQHVSRDPMMYEFADGMFADEPGLLRTRGEVSTLATIGNALTFRHGSRGRIISTRLKDAPDTGIVVVPTAVYEVASGSGASKMTPVASGAFTGSVAQLGRHTFFGQIVSADLATWAGRYDQIADAWNNNAGFNASFMAARGDKMWRVAGGKTNGLDLSWTDDVPGSSYSAPVFSSDYPYALGRPYARDIAIIGPHAVVAVTDFSRGGSLISLDTSGLINPVFDSLSRVTGFVPFLNGVLLVPSGGLRLFWLQSVDSYRVVTIGGAARGLHDLSLLDVKDSSGDVAGFYGTEYDDSFLLPLHGNITKRDGSVVRGSVLLQGVLGQDGFNFHTLLGPDTESFMTNAHVMAVHVVRYPSSAAAVEAAPPAQIQVLVAQEHGSNASQSNVKLLGIEVGRGTGIPDSFDTTAKFLRSSRYSTPSRTTAQMEVLRGYITKIPASNTVTVRVYLDGSGTETMNFSLNSAGPFSQALPTNVIGRDIAIDFETNANGSVVIEFPWSIDYFAVPDQKDIVRLPVLAGRDQLTRAATVQKRTRADILDTLAGIVASPERWTLSWWDATPDWDVIPIDYQAADTEPDFVPGAGAAVAWLTLQRL